MKLFNLIIDAAPYLLVTMLAWAVIGQYVGARQELATAKAEYQRTVESN